MELAFLSVRLSSGRGGDGIKGGGGWWVSFSPLQVAYKYLV